MRNNNGNNVVKYLSNKLSIPIIQVYDRLGSIDFHLDGSYIGTILNIEDRENLLPDNILKAEREWEYIYKKMNLL